MNNRIETFIDDKMRIQYSSWFAAAAKEIIDWGEKAGRPDSATMPGILEKPGRMGGKTR
ncbi:MAG: hypothetical protein V1921_05375 [Candidatus Altiarchaeota archaeon]